MASAPNKPLRVAIVHDWIYGGGAEKVVEQLHVLYPDAPIYTSYCSDEWRKRLNNKVITGYLQKWPFSKMRKFLPLLRQWWFASINLSEFDVIISSSGNGEAKFVKAGADAVHICYCHTPPHFYWRKYKEYLARPGFGKLDWLARLGLKLFIKPLRSRDYSAAQKVDYFIANSTHIHADIKKYYGRDSTVIYPPVAVEKFSKISKTSPAKNSPYIYWGRHVPDKRIDLAIEACNELNLPLVIIGEGVATASLKKRAGPTITFTGRISDEELTEMAGTAKAFIFPAEDDFGIAPVEALAAGLPVIAYKSGGALDYIIDGKTGTYFNEQTAKSLIQVLQKFDASTYTKHEIKEFSQQFSENEFRKKITAFLQEKTPEQK